FFHQGVLVTEGDADRVFYEEIHRRQTESRSGFHDLLVLKAQNAQTIYMIVSSLRRIGIRAASVVDFDMFFDGGTNWKRLLEASEVSQTKKQDIDNRKNQIIQAVRKLRITDNDFRTCGVSCIPEELKSETISI
ncbi:unnamed protein product, partial [marine sediment metagenome]